MKSEMSREARIANAKKEQRRYTEYKKARREQERAKREEREKAANQTAGRDPDCFSIDGVCVLHPNGHSN
jgi:hypothetical protein